MPGPTTEILNDDLKELRADFHRLEVSVATSLGKVETASTAAIGKLETTTANAVGRLEVALAKQGAEIGVFRGVVLATAGAALTGILATVWTGGATSARLGDLERRVERIEGRFDRIETGIGKLVEQSEQAKKDVEPGKK